MKIEQWEIDRIKPYDKNPRRNDKAVEAVARSIGEFGFRRPIVVDAAGVIVMAVAKDQRIQLVEINSQLACIVDQGRSLARVKQDLFSSDFQKD